jgi:hypothetical protein
MEVGCLLEVFAGVNENIISATIKDVVVMAGDSMDLATLQASTSNRRVDVLPRDRDTQKTACIITRGWWRSFGYKLMLTAV